MNKLYRTLIFGLSLLAFTMCKKKENGIGEYTVYTSPRCIVSAHRQQVTINLSQITGSNWSYYTPTTDLWLEAVPQEGNTLLLMVAENETKGTRESQIVVTSGSIREIIPIIQDEPRYLEIEGTVTVRGAGETRSYTIGGNVSAPYTCSVDISQYSWLSATVDGDQLNVTATANEYQKGSRQGIVTIKGISDDTNEEVTLDVTVTQRALNGPSYVFTMPDMSESAVYRVMYNGQQIAEVCKEYLLLEGVVDMQAIVVYPMTADGIADLSDGYVASVLLNNDGTGTHSYSVPTEAIHGGHLIWETDNNAIASYSEGTESSAAMVVYIPGDDAIGVIPAPSPLSATVEPYLVEDKRMGDNNYTYSVVKVGKQYWLRENMRAKVWIDGTAIPTGFNADAWKALNSPGCCTYTFDDINAVGAQAMVDKYGAFYNFFAICGAQSMDEMTSLLDSNNDLTIDKISPTGFVVPKKTDINSLFAYVGDPTAANNNKLRRIRDFETNWSELGDENITGLSIHDGSMRNGLGAYRIGTTTVTSSGYCNMSFYAYMFTSTYVSGTNATIFYLQMSGYGNFSIQAGLPVRCIKK